MTLNKIITLQKLSARNGTAGLEVTEHKNVWANVSDIGVTTKLTAVAANRRAELQVICYRSEAEGYTHAEYHGERYRIENSGSVGNERLIKLIIAKEG